MMDYIEFQDAMLNEMQKRCSGIDFSIDEVKKLQGQSYTGMTVKPHDSMVAATLDLRDAYERYKEGTSFDRLSDGIAAQVADIVENMPSFKAEELTNYEHMKSALTVQVISTERNRDMLELAPHREIEDMSLVYRMVVSSDETGTGSFLVTNEMLEQFGVTPDQLHEDAIAAAMVSQPATLRTLADVMRQLMGEDMYAMVGPTMPDEPLMYVASVEGGMNGAGVISYPGFMEQAAQELGSNFFVLPSSIHEVLLVPDNGNIRLSDLEDMVRDVNETEVSPEDRLSDSVYHYDAEAKVFELAGSYEQRMADRENQEVSGKQEMEANDNISGSSMGASSGPVMDSPEEAAAESTLTVLLISPECYPEKTVISNDLVSLQDAVGGDIEVTYPFEDNTCLIVNEEGKINGLPLNRSVRDDDGEVTDIVAGSFLVAGLAGEGFASLTDDQLKKYADKFRQPEAFVKMGKGILSVKIPDDMVKNSAKQKEKDPVEKVKPAKAAEVLS